MASHASQKRKCRACKSVDDVYGDMMDALSMDSADGSKSSSSASSSASSSTSSSASSASTQSANELTKLPCPPDSRRLGRSTWTYLHSLAAYFPDKPSLPQEEEMKTFVGTFSRYYPCGYCADHMQEYMQRHPVTVHSRSAFGLWMCNFHNEVNENLGKEKFDCSRIDERWLTGCDD